VTFRQILIFINLVAILVAIVIVAYRVLSVRKNPPIEEPQNLTPFLDDNELEGTHLDRVLGWALFFTVIVALSLPLYFIFEPSRQSAAKNAFDTRAVERGAILYANSEMPQYNSAKSLLCANCHGTDLKGGSAPFVVKSEDPACDVKAKPSADRPECLPEPVTWRAPALDTVMLRYQQSDPRSLATSDPREDQVRHIITYGRPGTPMPAWGVESNKGVLNEQGISDLIAFLYNKQISEDDAKQRSARDLAAYKQAASDNVESNQTTLEAAQADLAANPDDPDLQNGAEVAQRNLDYSIAWNDSIDTSIDGALMFQLQCARCHTKNWSWFDPSEAPLYPWMEPGPQGGGAFGPNLTGGSEVRQFPGAAGPENQHTFVSTGFLRDDQYGVRGISTGRMPYFSNIITEQQIKDIIEYERSL
jgi:mono/diheme cytochrome c family protein/cytochrome c553